MRPRTHPSRAHPANEKKTIIRNAAANDLRRNGVSPDWRARPVGEIIRQIIVARIPSVRLETRRSIAGQFRRGGENSPRHPERRRSTTQDAVGLFRRENGYRLVWHKSPGVSPVGSGADPPNPQTKLSHRPCNGAAGNSSRLPRAQTGLRNPRRPRLACL